MMKVENALHKKKSFLILNIHIVLKTKNYVTQQTLNEHETLTKVCLK